MKQNFNLVYQTCFENNSLSDLQEFCNNLMSNEPEIIFRSLKFVSISEKSLISILKSVNLQMNQVQVWEHVLKWGIAQNPGLPSNPSGYSKDNFNTLKNTLQQCIPLIGFYSFSSKEFSDKVYSYRKVLPKELRNDILKHFLETDSRQRNTDSKLVIPLNATMLAQIATNATTSNSAQETAEVASSSTTLNATQEANVTSNATTQNITRSTESIIIEEVTLISLKEDIQFLFQEYEQSSEIYCQQIMKNTAK
ncbi:hypothetical protein C1645_116405 [Glomus cerebriforme]|uniref:BACK domain-containing protein n=1 Tax=Glomus cerebriforme TaxID=658196 RepID=A0A397T5U0_9GLOM|nr:hypothetical protein C1645_116405 [Glomus cerebriforme]